MFKRICFIGFFILILSSPSFCEEKITITTYYPSPYGSYNELTTTGNTYLATTSGNVGIGTASPNAKLHIASGFIRVDSGQGITAGGTMNVNGDSAVSINTNSSNAVTINSSQLVGIGTGSPGYRLDVASGGATTARFGTAAADTVVIGGGVGKITCGTFDPVFNIDGEKYATYLPDFAGGVRVEASGSVELIAGDGAGCSRVIDFKELEGSSDLWLFWQASSKDLSAVSVLLTPEFEGKAWYSKKDGKLTIYADHEGEVSYRLSAPRVDHEKWSNIAADGDVEGIDVSSFGVKK